LSKFLTAFLVASLLLLGAPTPQQQSVTAHKALDFLLASKFSEFARLLTPAASQKLTPDFLREHVGREIHNFGKVEGIDAPLLAKQSSYDLVSFPVRFSKTTVNVQFTMDESGRVAGLYFRTPQAPLPATWTRPAYSKPEMFRERPVIVGSDDWKLGGTLSVPVGKGPFPAVVLVHGPGPADRDESIAASRIFADLAEGLASRGIAVLRYDKRTQTYSSQFSSMVYTLQQETIEDAVRALALLRTQPEVDPKRVFILGHSLGGYAIPRIARQDGKLAGAVLFAANARPIEVISVAQTESMLAAKGGPSPAEAKRLELMKAEAARVHSLMPGPNNPQILLGLPVEYFLDLKNYDPVASARQLSLPILVLQGGRDFQVTKADFDLWKTGLENSKNVRFHNYPTLNHLFISGDGPSSLAEYGKGGNVSAAVIDDLAGFITSTGKSS
jgi:dienelactone hydrolase